MLKITKFKNQAGVDKFSIRCFEFSKLEQRETFIYSIENVDLEEVERVLNEQGMAEGEVKRALIWVKTVNYPYILDNDGDQVSPFLKEGTA